MADHDLPDDTELASAYLDGEVTAAERARVEGDLALLAEVERLRRVRAAVADVPPAPATARESAIAAALAAFDEAHAGLGAAAAAPTAPPNVVPLARRRHVRRLQVMTAAAAAAVMVIGGFVIANRDGGDDDTASDEVMPAAATTSFNNAARASTTSEPTTTSAPTTTAATTTTTAAAAVNEEAAADLEQADQPMAAAPPGTTPFEAATAAGAAATAAEPTVLHDGDELRDYVESLVDEPEALDDVAAACEVARPSEPDAIYVDENGHEVGVVVAATTDGYAAVSISDCTVVLRTGT
jgi:hypothetical protein